MQEWRTTRERQGEGCDRSAAGTAVGVAEEEIALVGRHYCLVMQARGFSLRRSQRGAYIVGLNKSGSESASRSPNDTQKNGAPPLNRQNGGGTFWSTINCDY